jgi:CHAT domain-containing protein
MLKGGAGAEAISGLGQAFFYAGARSLLVTARPVETKSAESLTTRLFERRHPPVCPSARCSGRP